MQFDGARGILEFQLTPTEDVVYFASWAVHTYERESLNVARWIKSPSVKVQVGAPADANSQRQLDMRRQCLRHQHSKFKRIHKYSCDH